MSSALIDLCYVLQAAIRVRSSRIARTWRDGILDALLRVVCASPAWSTANVEGVSFDGAARVAGHELLLNGVGLRLVFVIKGYVAGLYLPERTRDAAVVLGMKGPKQLQTHPLRNAGADTFIHTLNDGTHCNQTGIQMQKLADRLTQLESATRQIGSTKHDDTTNFDYAPDAGTTISINDVAHTKAVPSEDFYQAMPSIFIGNGPVDRESESELLRSRRPDDRYFRVSPVTAQLAFAVVSSNRLSQEHRTRTKP